MAAAAGKGRVCVYREAGVEGLYLCRDLGLDTTDGRGTDTNNSK